MRWVYSGGSVGSSRNSHEVGILWGVGGALEHVKHSLSHDEASKDVDERDESGRSCKTLNSVSRNIATTHEKETTHSSDARDSIGDGHERGVEGRDDTPDSVVTNNTAKGHGGGHVGEGAVRRAHAKCSDGSETSCVGQSLLQTILERVWFCSCLCFYSSAFLWWSSCSYRDGGIWWPGGHSFVKNNRATHNIVSHVKEVVILGPLHGEHQLGQVVGVQGGCLGRKARWQIRVSDVGDIVVYSQLSRCDGFDVATGFSCKINHNTARLHVVDHVLLDKDGSSPAGDQGGGDHDINIFALIMEQLHFCFNKLLGHLLSIATLSRSIFNNIHLQELSTHTLYLFLDSWPHIKSPDNCPHILSLPNSCKTSNSTTNNKHLGWRNLSSCSDLTSEKSSKMIRSLDHCSVTTDISHGGESIENLSSGDSWHAVHAKSSHLLVSQSLDKIRVLARVQEGIKNTLLPEKINLL